MKKYKYLIASLLLIIITSIFLLNNYKKKKIYILYEKKDSICYQTIDKYYKNKYYILCDKEKIIFFDKKNEPIKIKRIQDLKKFKTVSKKFIFQKLPNSLHYKKLNDSDYNESKEFEYYIIEKDNLKQQIKIVPVTQIIILS